VYSEPTRGKIKQEGDNGGFLFVDSPFKERGGEY